MILTSMKIASRVFVKIVKVHLMTKSVNGKRRMNCDPKLCPWTGISWGWYDSCRRRRTKSLSYLKRQSWNFPCWRNQTWRSQNLEVKTVSNRRVLSRAWNGQRWQPIGRWKARTPKSENLHVENAKPWTGEFPNLSSQNFHCETWKSLSPHAVC